MSTTAEDNRLLKAVHVVVEKIVQEQGQQLRATMGPDFVDSLTEIVYKQMETFALDTEKFASHARRAVINADDVMLCARRNDDLYNKLSTVRNDFSDARPYRR